MNRVLGWQQPGIRPGVRNGDRTHSGHLCHPPGGGLGGVRLYRRSRETRFAIVTFALGLSSMIPFVDLVNPPQDFFGEWFPTAVGGMAMLLTAVILVRTLTELTSKFDEVRQAHDALEQRVANRRRR